MWSEIMQVFEFVGGVFQIFPPFVLSVAAFFFAAYALICVLNSFKEK